jgi:hypothetical protein
MGAMLVPETMPEIMPLSDAPIRLEALPIGHS